MATGNFYNRKKLAIKAVEARLKKGVSRETLHFEILREYQFSKKFVNDYLDMLLFHKVAFETKGIFKIKGDLPGSN